MDISWAEKRLNLSDKLFIVNYLLSSTLCMCTVFINLTGILVVPQKAAQCKFCIFWCNFQFLSPCMLCVWNSALPHDSSLPRLSAPLWNPPPALLPEAGWTRAMAAFFPWGRCGSQRPNKGLLVSLQKGVRLNLVLQLPWGAGRQPMRCARLAWLAALLPHSLPKRCANTLLTAKHSTNTAWLNSRQPWYSVHFTKNATMLSPLDSDGAKWEQDGRRNLKRFTAQHSIFPSKWLWGEEENLSEQKHQYKH